MSTSRRGEPATQIVRAGPEDAFIVAALSLQLALDRGAEREDGFLDRAADHWLHHQAQLPVWIAQRGGAHAGYLQAVRLPDTPWPGQRYGRLWVQAVFVAPEHRRHGVGRSLLSACEEWAKGAGVRVVRLRAEPGAEEFWEAAGFLPDPQVRRKDL